MNVEKTMNKDLAAGTPPDEAKHAVRSEWKFSVPEMFYAPVRDEIRHFLQRDPHVAAVPGGRYLVRSLYFDTPFLDTYHARLEGHAYRTRLRLRRYETPSMPPSDWFLEIKGKTNDLCLKTGRIMLSDSTLRDHLRQHRSINVKRLIDQHPLLADHLAELWSRPLQPTMLVLYDREPFIDPRRPEFRVTFDTHVRTVATHDPYERVSPTRRILDSIVMETKFDERMPCWLHGIIQKFHLERISLSKYCLGLDARLNAGPGLGVAVPNPPSPRAAWQLAPAVRSLFGSRAERRPAPARAWKRANREAPDPADA